jgi:hypothetical protein
MHVALHAISRASSVAELIDSVAAIVPKPSKACTVDYFVIFNSREVAARFLSSPDVLVAYVDVVFNTLVPTRRAVYHVEDKVRTRLFMRMYWPKYVEQYVIMHLDDPHDISYINVWATKSHDVMLAS